MKKLKKNYRFVSKNMSNYHQPLIPNNSYHLFSRAVGSEKLFLNTDNYLFFLQKLKQHTSAVCEVYSYSLIPNHFHLFVRIRNENEIIVFFEEIKKVKYNILQHNISDFIMERFSNFLNSYTKAFNKQNNRKGALFIDYLKRSIVNNAADFNAYIWYIHKNAVHHKLTNVIGKWQFDSYKSIISKSPTALLRNEVIEWFGNRDEFIKFHKQTIIAKEINIDIQ